MSLSSAAIQSGSSNTGRTFMARIGFMVASAVILSASIITYFNSHAAVLVQTGVQNSVTLAAQTLFPYMLSAAVAAITSIGVIAMLPLVKRGNPTSLVQERLHRMAEGDLTTPLNVGSLDMQMKGIVHELNRSVNHLGKNIAELKVINRQQWDYLESVRVSIERGENKSAMAAIQMMDRNWQRIAEIEEKLVTG